MLDHEHSVSHIAQGSQRVEQAVIVAWMQSDRRLVEHIEHTPQFGADLRREPNSLGFTARERRCGAIQTEIVESYGFEEFKPAADLIDNASCNLQLAVGRIPRSER